MQTMLFSLRWALALVSIVLITTGCPTGTSVQVPDLSGLSLADAQSQLSGNGLVLGTVSGQHSSSVPGGNVITQNPAAGTDVELLSPVDLVLSTGPEPVATPNLVGLAQPDALDAVTSAGLVVRTITEVFDGTAPTGQVISQTPTSGTLVLPGTNVDLVVSKGPEPVNVPAVVGLLQADAQNALVNAGLTTGLVTQAFSDTVAAGEIISQTPLAGTSVLPNTMVDLVVSKGPQPVEVPNVVGLPQADAQTAIINAKLTVGAVTEQYSDTVSEGEVISQSPDADTSVLPTASVDLVISKGPEPVEVPNLVGLSETDAQTAVTEARLIVGTITDAFSDTVARGIAISQDPTAGTSILPGAPVSLVISAGPVPVAIGSIDELQKIGSDPDYPFNGNYYQANDIDASATASWNGGAGFVPIPAFSGTYDGQGYVVAHLVVRYPSANNVGLFGLIAKDGVVRNTIVEGGTIVGRNNVGGLAGSNQGTVTGCLATGVVFGQRTVGGLIGLCTGSVSTSFATGPVFGDDVIGGLLGESRGPVSQCYTVGTVSTVSPSGIVLDQGALIGRNSSSGVTSSFWSPETSGLYNGHGGTVKTLSQMMMRSTFTSAGWNFDAIWTLTEGKTFPHFKDLPPDGTTYAVSIVSTDHGHVTLTPTGTIGPAWSFKVVTAVPDPGYAFAGWAGAGPDSNNDSLWLNPLPLVLYQDLTLEPIFLPEVISVSTIEELQGIGSDALHPLDWNYALTQDIDASQTATWNDGAGFKPIASDTHPFIGQLNGMGYTISGLTINRPSEPGTGLVAVLGEGGSLLDLHLAGGSVSGWQQVGSLLAVNRGGAVSECSASTPVDGQFVGGLIGEHNGGTVSYSYATGNVTGSFGGGLIGSIHNAVLTDCYARGMVTGSSAVGGLIGYNSRGTVTRCYAVGLVVATRAQSPTEGGLIGSDYESALYGKVTASVWDTETSGQATSEGGSGKTTAEMMTQSTFTDAGWDFGTTWTIQEGVTYPYLQWEE